MRLWFPLVLLAGCVPELVSPGPLIDWTCPENSWGCPDEAPDLVGRSYGFFPGDTLPKGVLLDQFEDEVDIWQFHGKVLVIDVSTMWCAPCRAIACYAEHTYKTYESDGFVYITVIPQNTHGGEPAPDDIDYWVESYSLTAPVLADPLAKWSALSTTNGQYPAILVVDRDMVVTERIDITGEADSVDRSIRLAVEAAGGFEHVAEDPESICVE